MEPKQETKALTPSLPPPTLINGLMTSYTTLSTVDIDHGVSTDRSTFVVHSSHSDDHRDGGGGREGRMGGRGAHSDLVSILIVAVEDTLLISVGIYMKNLLMLRIRHPIMMTPLLLLSYLVQLHQTLD
ncbi:unnamed protein product [Ilex paraguariensis]|uniref:Uncharacterized protein n=1 Tax=Ilex paraguariensis TaxID=185542 RepID=A0ABC8SUD5_9AQUA